ncbi:BTB/POZ domain-containing protein [Forsythia ovata]|uniref:BTB/POZ domain-containing protein n=1 Tax=Forsythia ovata TaxID=205694 RepID=A0ABD1PZC1_9LAMI
MNVTFFMKNVSIKHCLRVGTLATSFCCSAAAIGFDAGVLSCLEYLEAAPWAEDEEEKVASLLSKLRLEEIGAEKVLKRVSLDVTSGVEDRSDNEEVLLKLL